MLLLALGGSLAWAHPFGGTLPGHELRLLVREDELELRYAARIPTHDVMVELKESGETDPAAFTAEKLADLARNVRLRVDGADARWTPVPAAEPTGEGNSRSITYTQVLRAPLPPGARELAISNGNYPDQTSYFFWKVELQGPLRVEDCSLLDREEDRVLRTRDAQWRMDEAQRELTLRLVPRAGALARLGNLLMPPQPEPMSLEAAMDLGFSHELRSGRLPPQALAAGLVGAALLGSGLRATPRRVGPLVALAALVGAAVGWRVAAAVLLCALPGGLVRRAPRVLVGVGGALLVLFVLAAAVSRLG